MDLARQLSELPVWLAAILVVGLPTAVAVACSAAVRRQFGFEGLRANNEVAGFKFAVLGVVYAVLLGFAVIVVWEKFHTAEVAVTHEAGVAATLFRLSDGLPNSDRLILRTQLSAYIDAAIEDDWPAMARGAASPKVTQAVNNLYKTALANQSDDYRGVAILSEILRQLDLLTQERRTRITFAEGIVPGVVWAVLLFGAVATVSFTFFFGTLYAAAQLVMTGLLTAVIFTALLVILSINCPFTGPTSVSSEPLAKVLKEFGEAR